MREWLLKRLLAFWEFVHLDSFRTASFAARRMADVRNRMARTKQRRALRR